MSTSLVFHAPHQPTTTSPSVASANQHAGTINQTTTNAIPSQDPLFHAPGAFAIYGPSDVVGGHDDDNFTYTQQTVSVVDNAPTRPTEPVEAHLVDNADDVENLQEQLQKEREARRRQEEELDRIQRRQENIVVGQVLGVSNNDEDDEEKAEEIHSNKEDLSVSSNNKSMCGLKRKVTIAVVAVLVIVAVIVGVVVAMLLKSARRTPTTMDDWTDSCDESSHSLAKRLPCVSQDESKFCCDWLWQQYWCVFIMWTTFILVCHILSTASLSLNYNSLTGTIPSELGLLTKLSELSVVWLLVVMIVLSCVFFIVLSCLLLISHSTAWLNLSYNSLMGTIPSQIALLSNLCESSVVWLLVVMIVLSCVFFIVLSCLLDIFHSTAVLGLGSNSLTGTIPSELGLLTKLGESSVVWLLVVMIVLSCVLHCTLMLACHFSFYRYVVSQLQ
jgi:hypothetical protein